MVSAQAQNFFPLFAVSRVTVLSTTASPHWHFGRSDDRGSGRRGGDFGVALAAADLGAGREGGGRGSSSDPVGHSTSGFISKQKIPNGPPVSESLAGAGACRRPPRAPPEPRPRDPRALAPLLPRAGPGGG